MTTGLSALEECDREPIHIPGGIQPHGIMLALGGPEFRVEQASANAPQYFDLPLARVLGANLDILFGPGARELRAALESENLDTTPAYLMSVDLPGARGQSFQLIAHRRNDLTILEIEEATNSESVGFSNVYRLVTRFMSDLAPAKSIHEMNRIAAREIRHIIGFDRVLIYRFDDDWNGTVVAEDRNEFGDAEFIHALDQLPSYLNLRFPASDIPAQARELYRLNRLRLIPNVDYAPIPIVPDANPRTGEPLDLTLAVLRSISPVHIQYLKNMGTAASMSISILRDGALWGLVSCHNKQARRVSFEVRNACDMIAQALSVQIAAAEHRADSESRISPKSTQTRLLAHLAGQDSFLDGLTKNADDLLACTGAAGAAILYEGQCRLLGTTPDEAQVRHLAGWLDREQSGVGVFSTDRLAEHCPAARDFAANASGMIAASISSLHDSYIIWFRPEVEMTVRMRSHPWRASEIDSARDLREAIVRIVLRKAEEMAQLNAELTRSNQELEAFSYSVSHDLRAPFRHIVGFAELLREREADRLSETGKRYIGTIIESAHFAGTLVDNLLSFSRIGRASLKFSDVDTATLADEVQQQASVDMAGRDIEWRIGELPRVRGDLFMLRLVFQNLISNAIKYTRPRQKAIIEIGSERGETETVFFVRDNGVGFDARYASRLFGIFQRLHRMEEFEGTGIGLANVRRIVSRHGGRTWAEGEPDHGATFYFTLPDLAEAKQ